MKRARFWSWLGPAPKHAARLPPTSSRRDSSPQRNPHTLAIAMATYMALSSLHCTATQRPDGGSGPLASGDTVSGLTAIDQRGQTLRIGHHRSNLTVVYFYPKDGTPGCTAEACAFRDVWARYEAANITVIGVSNDDSASHAAFAKEQRLPFSLVADTDGTWAKTFGVSSFAGFYARTTFLLSPNGVVLKTYRDVDPGLHAQEILRDAERYRVYASASAAPSASTGEPTGHTDVLGPAPRVAAAQKPSVALTLRATPPQKTRDASYEFWLGATFNAPPGSRLYWKYPGEVGLPTQVEFSGPGSWQIGETQYPGPTRFDSREGTVAYGYLNSVTLVARVVGARMSNGTSFRVHGSWLSCDVRCVKEQDTATVSWHGDGWSAVLPDEETTLATLVKDDNPWALSAHFDANTRELSIGSTNHAVAIIDVFPEQHLGPDDRAPQRTGIGSNPAVWKWQAALEPRWLTVRVHAAGSDVYSRVAR